MSSLRTPLGRATIAAGMAAAAAYRFVLRRRLLTWGATPLESAMTLPGDELLPDPDGISTRAIGIEAPPGAVWPWLVQMGPAPRGGAYTYDWIENLLGLDMHSVDVVLPQFQHPMIGDTIAFGSNRMGLALLAAERAIAWRSQDGNWVWSFVVTAEAGRTRLISRNAYRLPTLPARLAMALMEPGSLIMERKMLLGIKQRAERLGRAERPSDPGDDPLQRIALSVQDAR